MDKATRIVHDQPLVVELPSFLFHPSFEWPQAEAVFHSEVVGPVQDFVADYMPDDVTRTTAQRMHYAAYRCRQARDAQQVGGWKERYYRLRDQIVLGNRKLVFRAVRRWKSLTRGCDDLIGECYLVLIRATAAYNPWLGVRFSTYAYTCLIRALNRQSQRGRTDWLVQSLSLESVAESASRTDPPPSDWLQSLNEFLRADHPLLSPREKTILQRRFCLRESAHSQTLEQLGNDLGLSKERVRQVQATALVKLRKALSRDPAVMQECCV